MAQFSRTHGDYQPVMNFDAPAYTVGAVNAVTSGATVQPQGPKLDYITLTATGALSTTQVNIAIQTAQQLATVYIYEYTDDTNDTLALALYPTGAWTASSLATAVTTAFTDASVANTVTGGSSATFTN